MKLPILIKTDGTITEITPENGKDFRLAELVAHIDCQYIELIDLKYGTSKKDLIMIGDEEGRFKGEDTINKLASLMYEMCWDQELPAENALTRMLAAYDAKAEIEVSQEEMFNIYGNIIVCKNSMMH